MKPAINHPWRKSFITQADHDKLSWFSKNRLKLNQKEKGYTAGSNNRYKKNR